jgi:hypothetical protein
LLLRVLIVLRRSLLVSQYYVGYIRSQVRHVDRLHASLMCDVRICMYGRQRDSWQPGWGPSGAASSSRNTMEAYQVRVRVPTRTYECCWTRSSAQRTMVLLRKMRKNWNYLVNMRRRFENHNTLRSPGAQQGQLFYVRTAIRHLLTRSASTRSRTSRQSRLGPAPVQSLIVNISLIAICRRHFFFLIASTSPA